jgi:hypothetical protein
MRWVSLAGTAFIVLYSLWLLLVAYRLVGKARGQDPKYDGWVDYWAGTFKVVGVIGIIVLVLQVVVLLFDLF